MIMPAALVDLETLLRFPSAQQCRIGRAVPAGFVYVPWPSCVRQREGVFFKTVVRLVLASTAAHVAALYRYHHATQACCAGGHGF